MKRSSVLTVFAILFIIISSCSTGKNALKKGDYYEATIQSVNRLRSNPDSKNARETIEQSYPMALDYYRQKVDEILKSSSPDKYLSVVDIYKKLNTLADEISRCPAALNQVKPVVYFHDQLSKALEMAISEQYNSGVQLLRSQSINDARTAIEKFEWVKNAKPGYADVDNKLAQAIELATIKVVIEPIPYMGDQYTANINRFYSKLYADISKNSRNRFVRFYQAIEAEQMKIVPDQIVSIQFVDFAVGNVYEKETEKDYVSDSLVIGTFKDDKGISHNVMGTVKAKAHIHEREVVSRGVLNVRIMRYPNKTILENRNFPGEYVWRNQWATFNGDDRALPENVKKMTKLRQALPPLPQDLFVLFSDPLASDASTLIKNYYRNK